MRCFGNSENACPAHLDAGSGYGPKLPEPGERAALCLKTAHLSALAQAAASTAFRVPHTALMSPARSAHIAQARQTAVYLAHAVFGLSVTDLAEHFHRHRTTLAHALERVEVRRDNRMFDSALNALERGIAALKFWSDGEEASR